jgi:hypothetical protein
MSSTTQFVINEFRGSCAFKAQPFVSCALKTRIPSKRADETAIAGVSKISEAPEFSSRICEGFVRTIESV